MAIFPTPSRLAPRFRAMIAVGLMALLTSHGAHYRDRWQRLEFYRGGGRYRREPAKAPQGSPGPTQHTCRGFLRWLRGRPSTIPNSNLAPRVQFRQWHLN